MKCELSNHAAPMNRAIKILAGCLTVLLIADRNVASDPPKKEARVTKIIRDVNILYSDAPPREAVENDQVNENTALRTGDESRSELTFDDMTITRLGENTIFSFNKAGHSGDLGSGSILVYVPKGSGGAELKTKALSVGVTGTTYIFESTQLGNSKLIVLEGNTHLRLAKDPRQSRNVRAGQMLATKAGATELAAPVDVDLAQIVETHPLITDFPPLPSQNLIIAAIQEQQGKASGGSPVSHGQPVISRTPAPAPAPSVGVVVGVGPGGSVSPGPSIPVVRVSANPTELNEEGTAVYTIAASNVNPRAARTIKYSMSGTGRSGRDYTLSSAGQVTIPAGASSANVILTALGRDSRENQTATMILQPGPGYKLSSQYAATITIFGTMRSTPTPRPTATPTSTPTWNDRTPPPRSPLPTPTPGLIHLPPKPSPTPRLTPTPRPKGGASPHKTPRPSPRPTRPPKENRPPLGTVKPPKKGLPSPTPSPPRIF